MTKPWYKWYAQKWLESEARKKLSALQRYMFRVLMDLSHCGSDPGRVLDPTGNGLTPQYLCELMAVNRHTLTRGLNRMVKLGMIEIDNKKVIVIVDYWKYQPIPTDRSKYWKERWAKQRGQHTPTHNVRTSAHTPEREKEIEREKETHTTTSPADKIIEEIESGVKDSGDFDSRFQEVFFKAFGFRAVVFTIDEGRVCAEILKSEEKLFAMMRDYGGKRKKWEWLVNDVHNPRNKPSKREAKKMDTVKLDCPKCKAKEKLESTNANISSFVCITCGYSDDIPADLTGFDIGMLSKNQQNIIKQKESK